MAVFPQNEGNCFFVADGMKIEGYGRNVQQTQNTPIQGTPKRVASTAAMPVPESLVPESSREVPAPPNLRNRWLAAMLAWAMPGLGHFYQRRYAKGTLFAVVILALFVLGCRLASDPQVGTARCVYVPMAAGESRLMIYCQTLIGLPAMPAWYQAGRVRDGMPPLWNGFMAPPKPDPDQVAIDIEGKNRIGTALVNQLTMSRLAFVLQNRFEFGGVCTLIAALLNLLVILDAFSGPAPIHEPEPRSVPEDGDAKDAPDDGKKTPEDRSKAGGKSGPPGGSEVNNGR